MRNDDDDEVDHSAYMVTPSFLPGERVKIDGRSAPATVMYVGPVPNMPIGYWVGVQYDEKVGKNDGSINGRRYFRCPPGHGSFVRATKIKEKLESDGADSAAAAGAIGGALVSSRPKAVQATEELPGDVAVAAGGDGGGPSSPTQRMETSRSTLVGSPRRPTVAEWKRDIAPRKDPKLAAPDTTVATGAGLTSAVVGSLAQFTIVAHSVDGSKCTKGGDCFAVTMRGKGGIADSQPALVRTKLIDRSDGTYMCEYRPWLTGVFSVSITLDTCHIAGSPFTLNVINLRPDAARCEPVAAVAEAVGKAVEAVGQAVEAAKEAVGDAVEDGVNQMEWWTGVDIDGDGDIGIKGAPNKPPSPTPPDEAQPQSSSEDAAAAASSERKDETTATAAAAGRPPQRDPTAAGRSVASDAPPNAHRQRSPQRDALLYDPNAPPPVPHHLHPPPKPTARSRPKSPRRAKSPRGKEGYKILDAPTRQRHLQLWATRQAADKVLARRAAEPQLTGKKNLMITHTPLSYAHELSGDGIGFAFGGVDPGTLHAKGKLVKVHSVHYSVGLAGTYRLHVGLRQQMTELPGSPFKLEIEPGKAYAASSKMPLAELPLTGIADEEWQHGLTFSTADMLGNVCYKGGATVTFKLSTPGGSKAAADAAAASDIDSRVTDNGDGTYELLWKSSIAGRYPIDVMIDSAHVLGSPTELTVRCAKPAVEQMAVSGVGISKAVAGLEAKIHVKVADRFANAFDWVASRFPFAFGVLLSSGDHAMDKANKGGKGGKGGKDKASNDASTPNKKKLDERSADSMEYQGFWIPNSHTYEIGYVAEEAGVLDLHLWVVKLDDDDRSTGERVPLPGSPFTVHVSEGNASHTGSYVGEAEAGKQGSGFVAGEHVLLRPQVRDQFGNASTAPEGALSAEWVKPGSQHSNPSSPGSPIADNSGTISAHSSSSSPSKPGVSFGGPSEGGPEVLPPPKMKGGLGSYEVMVEPVKAGTHSVHIKLHGQEITGSPVAFHVSPAAPSPNKCYLFRAQPPEEDMIYEKDPIIIRVTTVDKYGNQLDRGGVRVDAKALGAMVSSCVVEDQKDGTYTISLSAGAPGEVKVTVRIDGTDIPPFVMAVVKNERGGGGAEAAEMEEVGVPIVAKAAKAVAKVGEAVGKAVEGVKEAVDDAVEDGVNQMERWTGVDIDGDGDIGVKGKANQPPPSSQAVDVTDAAKKAGAAKKR